jgi:hypothetical protein
MLRMPDGTQVPMLNGVTELAANPWPGDVPYSRIIGKETDSLGQDWYVHADGTKSTMQMVWRSDLGRKDGVFNVSTPGPVLPPAPRSGAAAPDSKPADR